VYATTKDTTAVTAAINATNVMLRRTSPCCLRVGAGVVGFLAGLGEACDPDFGVACTCKGGMNAYAAGST
jgi:hypothetical protein